MATLKHIASKNSDYTAIEAYLIYQHDEFTGKQLLDEHGKPKLRESYLLDTLECGNFSFATACLLANRKYGKNTQHGDIKSHQYIISFDPRDAADNGLTMEKAQALGLKFCEENFSGHPAIVCTHPDGHNHSGNIHVHIVIGSIRTREVERKPYMQKPRDWREGMKHSSTAQTMRHLRVEVMELCEGAGLYQIDLLNGSKERVSEAEYWARRRGQLKLDRENAALTATGQQPKQKKFETIKDTLRKQLSSVLYRATSFEDFSDRLMQQYGITVKESRGQLSYLPSGRTKFIRAKHLGDKFDKAAVLATLQANTERKPKVQSKQDTIGKLIDIQSRMTEDKGIGYKRWLTKHNLKVMAQTVKLLQEKDLTDEDALNQRIAELETKYHDALAVVKDLEGRMKTNNELRYHIAAYTSTKNVAQQLKTAKRPAAFEEQHRAELTAYRAAAAYFKANSITKLPSPKKLEAEYAQLASEKAKFYEQFKEAKEELLKLKTAKASFFREEALAWICKNQLGRRNLTPEQKKFLMGKQYSSEKCTEAFRGNQHTVKKSGGVQSEHNQKPMKTCERIAQENHSSASSVRRAEYYAHGVDVADELSPGFRDRFFREELYIPDYLLENLGKAKPEEQAEIFEKIKNYVPKPKKVKPNKVTVKQAEKAASNTIDESYDVPQKFLELYYRLHNAESLMRKSWEVTFDLNPKLLTHPEQVKVLRFALKPHLEFLKTLDEVLAESSGESSKTA